MRRAALNNPQNLLLAAVGTAALLLLLLTRAPLDAARRNLAQWQQTHGRLTEAASGLQALVSGGRADAITRWQAGHLALRHGDIKAARTLLDPARLNTTNSDVLNSQLAAMLAASEDAAAAETLLRAGLPVDRMQRHVAAGLATALLNGRLDAAQAPPLDALTGQALELPQGSRNLDYLMQRVQSEPEVAVRLAASLQRLRDGWQGTGMPQTVVASTTAPALGRLPVAALGSELLTNGGFEQLLPRFGVAQLEAWGERRTPSKAEWERSAFALLAEAVTPFAAPTERTARIDGLAVQRGGGGYPALAGVQHAPVAVTLGQPYMLSFRYRTALVDESDARAFSVWISPVADFFGERFLPPTGGAWKRAAFLFRSKDSSLKPWLRLWAEGSVWVDDVSLRPLVLDAATPLDSVLIVPDVDAYRP